MRFVSSTTSSNPDYNAEFDYAFTDIGPEAAKQIVARHEMFMAANRQDDGLWEMYFWDSLPNFFEEGDEAEEWFTKNLGTEPPEGEVWRIENQKATLDGLELQSFECGQMILCKEGVRWTCIPKHTSIYITTETIPIAWIREIA